MLIKPFVYKNFCMVLFMGKKNPKIDDLKFWNYIKRDILQERLQKYWDVVNQQYVTDYIN